MKKFLNVFQGDLVDPPPIWLMRQAGRYLPEYRTVRAQGDGFLDLVYDVDRAMTVTMQPLQRFGFDAAILFSDILVVPHALGVTVTFTTGEGPQLSVVETKTDLEKLSVQGHREKFETVYRIVSGIRAKMDQIGFQDRALIGFAGAPWTLACYMISGSGQDHDFPRAVERTQKDPVFFTDLINLLTDTTIDYLKGQIKAGAEAIQLFDSWAGCAKGPLFDDFVLAPTVRIVTALRAAYPALPIIGFPRGAQGRVVDFVKATGVSGIQLDPNVDILGLRRHLGDEIVTQGNLDPALLRVGGSEMDRAIDDILEKTRGTRHIFNLGHGISPDVPVDHVARLVNRVRGLAT